MRALLLALGFLLLLPALAGADNFNTSEREALSAFSQSVVSGREMATGEEILKSGDALYSQAAKSIDNLLPAREAALKEEVKKSESLVRMEAAKNVRLGLKNINRWLQKKGKKFRGKAKRKKSALRKRVALWKQRELQEITDIFLKREEALRASFESAHTSAQNDLDAIYRYLKLSPFEEDFFSTMTVQSLTRADAQSMIASGIGSYRTALDWRWVQQGTKFVWGGFDSIIKNAAGLRVLPAFHGMHPSFGSDWRLMPETAAQKNGWKRFVQESVKRYGPEGSFWKANPALPYLPIRTWQVWNEPNDYWFTAPVNAQKYAALLTETNLAIKEIDPSAKVIAAGLYAGATEDPPRSYLPATFFRDMQKAGFLADGIALHPYAPSAEKTIDFVNSFREISGGLPLYLTEFGWQSDKRSAFGLGSTEAQAAELSKAYQYFLRNHRRLNLAMLSWFAWKDVSSLPNLCLACYESGLLRENGEAKPALGAFLSIVQEALSTRSSLSA